LSNLLNNKTALITGGAKGIGEAVVRAFVLNGAKVVFTYHNSSKLAEQLVLELGEEHVKAIQCDGTNSEEVQNAVKTAHEFLGRIDILVNNSGIIKDNLLLRMTEDEWDNVLNTNLKSVFLFSKFVSKHMIRTGGSIVNMSSIMGINGHAGQSNYAASKAGIIGFSKSIAQEYGSRNIRCNVIAPGWIQTDMTDNISENLKEEFEKSVCLKRIGQPKEVAQVALFLASEMSSYITGQVIQVCGGVNQ
jgi:3-oxoacyl-[acyl-carrier protein] reductase